MKIAFIGQKGIPAKSGGVERHVEELSVKLAEKGHEVFVYARNNYTEKNINEYKKVKLVHLSSVSTKHLDAIIHTFLATIHAIFQKYDVIHYHSIGPSSLCFLIKIFKRKTTLIATYHCQDYFHKKWGFIAKAYLKFGEFVISKVPDKTIVVTNIIKSFVKNKYNCDAVVIPNGMNVKKINQFGKVKERWNLGKDEYILTVGRLIKHKGVHYLIEAYKKLEDNNLTQGKKLVVVGDGFYTDDYVEKLKQLAGGRENIIFTGDQQGEVLKELFSNAYLFVQSSESEGLSIALLEAMGYGNAVLTSDIPENLEAIKNKGITFKSGDINDLYEKMLGLIDNFSRVNSLKKEARIYAQENYNWNNITKKIERVYKQSERSEK